MPKKIQLPDGNFAEFPDDMEDSAIESVLQQQFAPPKPEKIPGMEKLGALPGVPAPKPQMGYTNWRQGLPDVARLPLGAVAAVGKGGLDMLGGFQDAAEAVVGSPPAVRISDYIKNAQVSSEDGSSGDYFTPEEQSYDSIGGILNMAGSGVGSSLMSMIPGMGSGKLLSQIDKIKALGPGAQLAAKYLGGVAAGSAIETTADSGSAYRQVMDETGNHGLGQDVALETFKREMPATVGTNLAEYLLPSISALIPRALMGATFEGGQELIQGEMQRGAREKFGLPNGDVNRSRIEDFIGGAAGGLATGALMAGEGRAPRPQPTPVAAEAPKAKAEAKPAEAPTYTPEQYQAAVDLTVNGKKASAVAIRKNLNVDVKTANAMLGQMQGEGVIERKKTKNGGSWKVLKTPEVQPEAAPEAEQLDPLRPNVYEGQSQEIPAQEQVSVQGERPTQATSTQNPAQRAQQSPSSPEAQPQPVAGNETEVPVAQIRESQSEAPSATPAPQSVLGQTPQGSKASPSAELGRVGPGQNLDSTIPFSQDQARLNPPVNQLQGEGPIESSIEPKEPALVSSPQPTTPQPKTPAAGKPQYLPEVNAPDSDPFDLMDEKGKPYPKPLQTWRNPDGTSAGLFESTREGKFSVVLRDNETKSNIGIKLFPGKDQAVSYAEGLAASAAKGLEPAKVEAQATGDSTDKLIAAFSKTLDSGKSFGNITEFMGGVERETGLSSSRNEIQPKEAYDVLEAAVNRKLSLDGREDMKPGADFKGVIGKLRSFMSKLPTQSSRSETQIKFQQFSTPPTLSYFAARLAAPNSSDTVLEPSAGTGSLAAWAAATGAKVAVNEIDEKRADLLGKLGYKNVTRENAEQIHNVLPADVKPSVVLMNPPFSASGVRGGKNSNNVGYKHVEQAFNRLEPGGRLVVILGEGATLEAATAKPFWQSIAKKGSIRANIGVDGKEYAKYGTTFGNRVVVIDKTGATPGKTWTEQYAGIVKGDFGNIEDAWDAVKQIAEDRGQSNSVVAEGSPDQGARRPRTDTIQPGGNATAGAESATDRPAENPGGRTGARPAPDTRSGKPVKSGSRTEEVPAVVPASKPVDAKPAGELPTPADAPVQSVRSVEPTEAEIDSKFGQIIDAAAAEARARLQQKMRGSKLNSGIDPQDLLDLATIAVQKMRQHGISFKKWSTPYVEEMGDWVREHLQAIRDRAEELYDEWREAAIRQLKSVSTPKPEEAPAPKPAPKKLELVAKEEPKKAAKGEDDGENVFYVPAKLPASWGALPHKGLIVETQAMAATEEPDLTLKPNIPDELIRSGALTEVQINAVALAAMAHENMLDEETRQGFFIGDGTGVGKGREIAATVLHHWNQGVKRQVWVSYKDDLIQDAKRDLSDLGANIPIISIKKFKKGQPIATKFKEGIVFIPYTTLAGTDVPTILTQDNVVKKDQNNAKFFRVDQLAEWLGDESVIVFDEAHEAKNAVPGAAGRGKGQQSNAGRAVVAIQDRLKKARVLYASGTGFSDVSNLGYATRLGLWGKGTAFADFNAFQNAVAKGGIGAMEMVARDLKAQGKYVSRFLSYKGVDFEEVTHALTKDQVQILDSAGEAWRTIRNKMNEALKVTDAEASEAKKAANSVYWGANQRFYRTVYTAMKVPSLFASIDAALNKDHSVVISVMSTGEAAMKRGIEDMLSSNGSLDELDISPVQSLISLVREHFPVRQYEEYVDENGNLQARPVSDAKGNPVFNQDAIAIREALIKNLEKLRMPESALDQILNRYGADNVAEMTGRKQRLVENEQGERSLENRKGEGEDTVNVEEARQFQEGKKRIAIISSAASTGISLHADNRAKNRQRRTHIILELKWSADKQMQDFGRTHRTNEASQPVYQLLSLNIGPEKRFSSSIARRLEQMGALSRGDRGSSGAGDIAKYNFETPYGQAAVTAIIDDMKKNNVAMLQMMGLEDNADEDNWVNKIKRKSGQSTEISVTQFLNRLMSLPFREQNDLFDDFMGKFAEAIEVAKREGTFDQGAEKIQADKMNLEAEPIVVRSDPATGARTIHYQLEAINRRERLPWKMTSNFWSKGGRFFKQSESGQVILVDAEKYNTTTRADGSLEDQFLAITAGGTRRSVTDEVLKEKFKPVPADNATKALWDEQFEKAGPTRSETIHLIGGSVLPVYDKIESVQGKLRVQVAMLADKSRFIGLRIQNSKIKSVLRSLGFGAVLTPADVHEAVLAGEKYTLASGLQIKKIKRAGEDRIEVVIPAHVAETAGAIIKQNGGFTETIQFSERFFIPSDAKGVEALRGILSIYPVMEDSQGEVKMAEGKQDSAGVVAEPVEESGPVASTGKLTAEETKALRTAAMELKHAANPYVVGSVKLQRAFQERGWIDDTYRLTESGKAAAKEVESRDQELKKGLPVRDYKPGSGNLKIAEGDSHSSAYGEVDGKTWHTNGHVMGIGNAPQGWPAGRLINGIARAIPTGPGIPVVPVAFTEREDPKGKGKDIWFSNAMETETPGGVDSKYFDYIRARYSVSRWTQSKTGSGPVFMAWDGDKLVALVMGRKATSVPEGVARVVNQFNGRMDPESGVLRIDPAVAKVVRDLADRIRMALRSPAADPLTPVAKKTIRKLRQRQAKLDIADREYRAILRKVSGGDETKKLTQKQAEEALDRMSTATTPLTAVINSPSFVLGRSMAGARVYDAAEKAWFEQERLNELYEGNWARINQGTTKKQRNKIALYRFVSQIVEMRDEESAREWLQSIGEDASIVDELDDFLTEKEKKINADWTKFFFEPTRKMGIEKGLLKSEQQFTNYLSFYHDSMLRFNKSKLKDAAADLAIQLGLPVHLTEQILEKASPKKVKFGSFDYERQAWSIPGLRDADLIAEVYRKGFARKVAVTQFLQQANPLTKKIADPAVRTYARLYIKQYAGVPQGSVFFDAALNAIPAIRKLGLSGGQIAGWATATQYMSKIGYNLFTPALNLTQTPLNTFPAVGTLTALRVMPKSLAYTLLPDKLNPFRRSLVELKIGGIYKNDAGQSKFDRPVFHGVAENIMQSASFLFNKAESFNRATAYLAGLELARREGLKGEDAVKRARGIVRVTQFYSGRLDAPLFSRSPHGKILMQFKTFTVKQLEFVKMLPRKQQLEFLAWTVALGGPASLGILQAFQAIWPDWELTELLEQWHEEANIAAWIGAGRLRYQMGLFTIPGLEYLGSGQATAKISQWVMGPTFGTLTDIGDKGVKALKDPEKFDKFAESIIRGVTPGGAEIMRARKAYEEAENPEEAIRILTGTEPKK